MTTGLALGRFAPLHKGHQMMIELAIQEMEHVIVLIFQTDDIVIPVERRGEWIKQLYPTVSVVLADDCPDGKKYSYENGEWAANIQNMYIAQKLIGEQITHVYHSEEHGASVAEYLGCISRPVDILRTQIPISATQIRQDPHKNKAYLEPFIYEEFLNAIKND